MEDFVLTDEVFRDLKEIFEKDEFIEVPHNLETSEQIDAWLMSLSLE